MHTYLTQRANSHDFTPHLLPMGLDDCQREAQDDTEWQEFLALGRPMNPTELAAGTQWRNAPVQLCY